VVGALQGAEQSVEPVTQPRRWPVWARLANRRWVRRLRPFPNTYAHDGFRRIEREQPDPPQGNLAGYDAQGVGIRRFRTTRT
jgi:hypothetical protein